MPPSSMTGFASAEGTLPGHRSFSLTLKSVNHRHMDLSIRLPQGFESLDPALRQAIKATLRRGHVELVLLVEKATAPGALHLDEALLATHIEAFRRAATQFQINAEPDLNSLLRLPGVMSTGLPPLDLAQAETTILAAADEALARLMEARRVEGEALAVELRASIQRIGHLAEEARQLRAGVAEAQATRLRQRFQELIAGLGEVGGERILAEAALLADRGDVEEELVRLRTHLARFTELLDTEGESGRQLDFLLQELNREANTLLAKTGAAAGEAGLRLTDIGLAIKLELERAREQVQNLE